MNALRLSLIPIILLFVAVIIAQLWFSVFSATLFYKISITIIVGFFTVVSVYLIKKYFSEEENLKKR